MGPRPSSAASNETGHQRMPFAHAEALLWWPELRKQHEWLLSEMRVLHTQHDAYNTRIQTTEAVAEAAEATISRIRHIEQQIIAIEADDKDKAFKKWTAEEITQLKTFADRNQTTRQKQIELEKCFSSMTDDLSKLEAVSIELRSVQRRLDSLEAGQKQEADQIRILENKITNLEAMQRIGTMRNVDLQANVNLRQSPRRPKIQLRVQNVEDEDFNSPSRPSREQIQVPQTPKNLQRIEKYGSSTTKVLQSTSARLRLLKRASIHNSKIPKAHDENQHRVARSEKEPPLRGNLDPPATQIVHRPKPKKQEHLMNALHTERITRSQAKNQLTEPQQPINPEPNESMSTEPALLLVKQNKATTNLALAKKMTTPAIQLVIGSPQKRRKPNNVSNPRVAKETFGNEYSDGVLQGSTVPVKPAAGSRSARRAMPDIADYETYLKLRAEDKIP